MSKTKVICKHDHDRYGNVAWVLHWMKNEISSRSIRMILFLFSMLRTQVRSIHVDLTCLLENMDTDLGLPLQDSLTRGPDIPHCTLTHYSP